MVPPLKDLATWGDKTCKKQPEKNIRLVQLRVIQHQHELAFSGKVNESLRNTRMIYEHERGGLEFSRTWKRALALSMYVVTQITIYIGLLLYVFMAFHLYILIITLFLVASGNILYLLYTLIFSTILQESLLCLLSLVFFERKRKHLICSYYRFK